MGSRYQFHHLAAHLEPLTLTSGGVNKPWQLADLACHTIQSGSPCCHLHSPRAEVPAVISTAPLGWFHKAVQCHVSSSTAGAALPLMVNWRGACFPWDFIFQTLPCRSGQSHCCSSIMVRLRLLSLVSFSITEVWSPFAHSWQSLQLSVCFVCGGICSELSCAWPEHSVCSGAAHLFHIVVSWKNL